jgi:uncharacterized membrane protein YkvA (DUF1232 family)
MIAGAGPIPREGWAESPPAAILVGVGTQIGRSAAFVALWRQLRASSRGGPGIWQRLRALPRMVPATTWRRRRYGQRYDGLSRLGLMVAALAYLAWPLELIPELLLGPIGLIDDGVVVAWLAGAVLSETGRFLEWEKQRATMLTPGRATPPR